MKYVLVSGGVISGIGKGICASSTGFLLKAAGHRVTSIKIDPYLNIDAGTFSPYEHGECYVLDDGGEVDLDLGNYERFLDITLTQDNNITTGKVYRSVIEKERKGDYLGKTVQVVPHVTNEIQAWIERVARMPVDESGLEPEVCVIELGGTMGDIESAPFAEAMNAFKLRVGSENFMLVHVSLVPVIATTGESKTKPTQHSVRELRSLGMFPDVIVCRSTVPLQQEVLAKVSQFCHVEEKSVLNLHDCKSVWEVPLLMEKQNMLKVLGERLNLPKCLKERALNSSLGVKWMSMVSRLTRVREEIEIVVVGKYTGLSDTYLSITKALQHASLFCERKLELKWIEAEHLERKTLSTQPVQYHDAWSKLCGASGILVPGGFGHRGTEGKIHAAQWARENKIPYLGICLGMQLAVIEFARNVMGMEDANSTEFNEATANPVVMFMPEGSKTHLGGTMRLGQRKTLFHNRDSTSFKLYGGQDFVLERHRHRYEVNPEFVDQLEAAGLLFVGRDETGERMEITELTRESHPFMMGVQYHPEYLSRPVRPSPVFIGFILAAMGDAKLSEYLDNQAGSIHRYDSHEIIKDMETADV